jgi:hypothetical protein
MGRDDAKVDLKVYYNLSESDLYLLATFLNRTRRALKKGEYFAALVNIYDSRREELERETGKPQKESAIFSNLQRPEIADRDFDLAVGRIVGITAFDEEEAGRWYPFVGRQQHDRFEFKDGGGDAEVGYCPLTAGNMAEFLRPLCKIGPFNDFGESRAVEIHNVLRLGEIFRKEGILKAVKSYREPDATIVACKHWCIAAFGRILASAPITPRSSEAESILSNTKIDWTNTRKLVAAYMTVMEDQVPIIEKAQAETDPGKRASILQKAWSYQTIGGRVEASMVAALRKEVPNLLPEDAR